ncbi:MAG: tetratricopeptide repeat protein [Clostridium sp.]|uniref:tetratricopeptide repeat protein n=1 Tax=Clostridium sp. TaxID=1506 RepID=UPI0032170731
MLIEENKARIYCTDQLNLKLTSNEIDKIIDICEKYNMSDLISSAYIIKGNLLYEKNLFNDAFLQFNQALYICDNIHIKDEIFIYNRMGACKISTLHYEEALAYLCKCYSYVVDFNDVNLTCNCIFNLALTYKKLGEFDNAIIYIDKLLDICDLNHDFNKYIENIILKANCYLGKNEYHTAIELYTETLNKFNPTISPLSGIIYNNLGLIYLDINELDKALKFFKNATLSRESLDKSTLCRSLIDTSKVYIKQGLYSEAIELLEKGIILANEYGDKEYLLKGYTLLEDAYVALKDRNKLEEVYLRSLKALNDIDSCKLLSIYNKLTMINPIYFSHEKRNELLFNNKSLKNTGMHFSMI